MRIKKAETTTKTKNKVFMFNEGNKNLKDLLGGKGANLAEMLNIGLPVPYGFTITTEAYKEYQKTRELSEEVVSQIEEAVDKLEKETGRTFGGEKPLTVSVRSGAPVSMPGMMDTIINIGLNQETHTDIGMQQLINSKQYILQK